MNLRDCYNSSYIVVRENLLPMTMTTLIALLRKLETSTYNMNNRIFAPALLYQYRYDGIVRNPDVQTTQYVKPYSRSGKEYYLYKLQMNRIIPTTSSATINDDSLTLIEKCTLHAMLSLSIDKYDRGDGDVPCSRLSKYSDWNSRYPRDLSKAAEAEYIWYGSITPGIAIAGIAAGLNYQTVPYNSYFVQPRTAQRRKVQSGIDHYRNLMSTNRQQFGGYGNPQSPGNVGWPGSANGQSGSGYRPNGPGAYGQDTYGSNNGQLNGYGNAYPSNSQGNGYGGGSGYGGNGNQGGSGYGGNGYQGGSGQQGVNGYGSNPQGSGVNFGGNGYNQNGNVDVDSRYAATLSGIVALESLLQGPENQITIGSKGAWNSSSLPKYYFLQDWFDGNVLTDARIAGGVDVASGFDFPKVLSQLKVRFLNKLQNAVYTQSAGGIPHIVIFVPMTTTMTDNDKSNALDTLKYFKFNIPDVKFLYLVPGSKEAWTPFAENKDKDVIVASTSSSDMSITLQPLINRIKQTQINGPTLTVCKSRDTPHPTQNTTNSGSGNVFCTQITSSGNSFSFKVNDECSGDYYAAECRPIYFSVFNPQYPYGSSPASCRGLDGSRSETRLGGLITDSEFLQHNTVFTTG
ncbi:unnamed protein product, partial [Nesidiocoris tenuis]